MTCPANMPKVPVERFSWSDEGWHIVIRARLPEHVDEQDVRSWFAFKAVHKYLV